MTTIGTAVLKLQANTKGFTEGVEKAEKKTGKFRGALKDAAKDVPVLGDALSAMVSPMGALTAGIGAFAVGLGAAVAKVTAVERELRPMIERSGIAGESLQVLSRAATELGSQDGLDGVADSSQELQLRLAEVVQDGTGPAVAAFQKLGLSAEELVAKSPEQSFRDTVTALQAVNNEADRKFLADELMGGSSERLAGVLNVTAEEFAALTARISEQSDIISDEGLASAREFGVEWSELKSSLGSVATTIGTGLLPILTNMIRVIRNDIIPVFRNIFLPIWEALKPAISDLFSVISNDLLPALKGIWDAVAPFVLPVLKALVNILGGALKAAIGVVSGALKVVAGILTGDWSAAWQGVKKMVFSALKGVINIYNNTIGKIPGMAQVDLDKLEQKFLGLGETAKKATKEGVEPIAKGVEQAGTASQAAAPEIREAGEAVSELGEAAKEGYSGLRDVSEKALQALIKANKKAADKILDDQREAWGVSEEEYRRAQAMIRVANSDHLAMLRAEAQEAGIQDLAIIQAQFEKERVARREHHQATLQAERDFLERLRQENLTARERELAAQLEAWNVEQQEYVNAKALLRVANSEHIAMLQAEAQEAGIKDLALMQAIIEQEKQARIKGQQEMRTAELAERRQTMQQSTEILRIGFKEQEEVIAFSMASSAEAVKASAAQITAAIEAIPSQKTITISTVQSITGSAGGVTGTDDQGGELSTNVDLHGDGTGTVSTGNTGGEGGPGSESSQGFTLDESGNAYYDEGKTQPVDDDTQDAIDEVLGHSELARGGIVRPRAGGMVARLAEAGVPEAVIPLRSSAAMAMMGAGRSTNAQTTISIENVYGFDDFAEKVAEVTNQNVRLGAL